MGEIADAMLNGDLCEICGVFLSSGDGYPRKCPACKPKNVTPSKRRKKRAKKWDKHERKG